MSRVERRATVFAVGDLPQIVDPEQRKEFLGSEKRRYSGGWQNNAVKRGIPFGRVNDAGKVEGGLELNASYTSQPDGKIITDNLQDFILFEMMQNDKEVATDPNLFATDQHNYAFFCIDQTVETERAKELLEYKIQANEALTLLLREYREAPEKMETRLRAIASAVDKEASGLHFRIQTIDEAITSVMKGAEKDPQNFLKVLDDKKLIMKSFINDCTDAGIFQRIGNQYVYEGETYSTIDELVKYIKDPSRTELKVQLEARLKEFSAMQIITG